MPVSEVTLEFYSASTVEQENKDGSITNEPVPPQYVISIPNPNDPSHATLITAVDPLSTETDADGVYTSQYLRDLLDEGYTFRVITDGDGVEQSVLMQENDWQDYQGALSRFAQAASQSPNLYRPNAASTGFGLFAPQAQAGGAAPRATVPFRALTAAQIRGARIETTNTAATAGNNPHQYNVYEPTTGTGRALLRNAGYVEVSTIVDYDGETPIRGSRFLGPLDAHLAVTNDSNTSYVQ